MRGGPRIIGAMQTPVGSVPRVDGALSWADRATAWQARWTIGRMGLAIPPGIYALGQPTADAPVLVSANYRLSFDTLRSSLPGRSAWLLVLDTKGINVWCAAGKGTFGTAELVHRIAATRLPELVSHRTLIVPQLGAPGVSSFEVKAQSGFRVVFGPVRARDLPAFLENGLRATPAARRVTFPLPDRVRLIPAELVPALKLALPVAAAFLLVSGLARDGYSLDRLLTIGLPSAAFVLFSAALASTLVPLLLPWLPGRAFSLKGLWVGLAVAALVLLFLSSAPQLWRQWPATIGWLLIVPTLSSFLAMGFTGASTYTSLSGVLREMRVATRLQFALGISGLLFWIAGRFV